MKSTPIRVGNLVYFGSNDGKVYCVKDNGSSASLVWAYQTGSYVRSTVTIANDIVYVGSFNRYIYALNAIQVV